MPRTLAAPIVPAALSGCARPNPVLTDFNGSAVRVQTSAPTRAPENRGAARWVADRACATTVRRARLTSRIEGRGALVQNVYLCV